MSGRWALLAAASALLALALAQGCGALLAWLISQTAIDQPSLGDLALAWAPHWGILMVGLLAGVGLLMPPSAPRLLLFRLAWLLPAAAAALLAISLVAGASAALLERQGLIAHYELIPNSSRQAAAEAMLQAAQWAGMPVAMAVALIAQRRGR